MSISSAKLAGQPIVVGAGLAGLMTALHLAPEPCVVLVKTRLGTGAASDRAQGGVAAAVGGDDNPVLHAADTIAAGDGLCDPAMVAAITAAGSSAIAELARLGVVFDCGADGRWALGLEAAHGRRRIVHAAGDGTGHAILRALVDAVRATPTITVLEETEARRLLLRDGAIAGVVAAGPDGPMLLSSARVVIATGGLGYLYRHTTNPHGAIGQGLALAARAGAALADMEFVQFHPTALDGGLDPMPLVSEAVRGEGAILIDETGARFTAELEPRDVVARAVWGHIGAGHRVFLDARACLGARFPARFPGIAALCLAAGIDPATAPIPVRPAAHYMMGGIAVDHAGRSTVPGLWACGEAAATGLHGANRLASNSLLEAAVCGRWVAESVAAAPGDARPTLAVLETMPAADAEAVRNIMENHVGLVRSRNSLAKAVAALAPLAQGEGPARDPATVGLFVAAAALLREESRGGHWRSDYPQSSLALASRRLLRLGEVEDVARAVVPQARGVAAGA